ncbi:M48 family metalloprotease [Candidatus Micrarchaeota archaeon]|nr:M48 family metalloprotease [Candidatus Micrarchaeota archaeon]
MFGMSEHVIQAAAAFLSDGTKMTLVGASLFVALALVLASRNNAFSARAKTAFLYGHLAFLLFPIVFFAASLTCKELGMCEVSLTRSLLFTIPIAAILALAGGLFVVPLLHRARGLPADARTLKMVRSCAREMGMAAPDVLVVDSGKPEAYSVRGLKPTIFVSVGMLEVLSKKELEAVVIHELCHLKEDSHALKNVAVFLGSFYPRAMAALMSPSAMISAEENKADGQAVISQKTAAHIRAAKSKIEP